jgi:uncharacterized membrane protein YbhN (UPF0104 family)
MNDKDARRDAVSEWLLEFSVLWAVFPLLDQLVQGDVVDPVLVAMSAGTSLTAMIAGLILRQGERP